MRGASPVGAAQTGRLQGGRGPMSLAWLPNRRQCHRSQTLLLLADGGWLHNVRVPARPACVAAKAQLPLSCPAGRNCTPATPAAQKEATSPPVRAHSLPLSLLYARQLLA